MIPVLVLRPEPGAGATARRARALGLEPIVAPLFAVAPLAWVPPPADAFDAVMLTSANAPRLAGAALARYRALPAYAVGEATAAAARATGFGDVRVAAGNAADLVALLAADGIGRALHPCGADRHEVEHPAVTMTPVVVYRADPLPELAEAARGAVARGAVALMHSPRAAARLAALVPVEDRARVAIAAISAAAAAGEGWRAIAIAAAPSDTALLAVAARLCEEIG